MSETISKESLVEKEVVTETDNSLAEEKTTPDESSEETPNGKDKKKKKSFLSENTLEILVAILLGITALLTAWATWIGSLHGGNQATNYAKSSVLASEGNSEYNAGMQLYLSDVLAFNTMMDYSFDMELAKLENDKTKEQLLQEKLENYMEQNCSQILLDGINWMAENGKDSPFEMEGLTDRYFETANELLDESRTLLEQGQKDNANGDAYNLVNVIYSVVLFMLGIVGIFKRLPNRAVVLIIALVGLVLATIYMMTIPMPTGFDITTFFAPK